MTRKFADLPISRKLGWLLGFYTLLALFLSTLVFTVGSVIKTRKDVDDQLRTLALAIGENSRAALAFGDEEGARNVLAALRTHPNILRATLYDADERPLASVGLALPAAERGEKTVSSEWFPSRRVISQPIRENLHGATSTVGHLELEVDVSPLWRRLLHWLSWCLFLALSLTLTGVWLGRRLHRVVTGPVQELAGLAHTVSQTRDYSLRATRHGGDEIGALVDDLNRMLGEIQSRDQALLAEQQQLEERVSQRTAQLAAAKDDAERANAAKSDFLSRMSHELRTPLNAILGFTELLAPTPDEPLTEQQQDNIAEIRRAGQQLLWQVNEVLDLSRIERGHLELSIAPQALAPLVGAMQHQLQPLADARRIRVSVDLPEEAWVDADANRLQQIIRNLLSNAIKYNRDGGSIHIHVEAHDAEGGPQRWRLLVSDSGRGIPAEQLPRLFRPFERLEGAYDGIEGSGIGLALVRLLASAMQGETGVTSVFGEGSTFWVELPRATPPHQSAPALSPTPSPAHPLPGNCSYRVLYIEDNLPNRKLVRKIISRRDDIELLEAVDAESGLQLARDEQPDLILMDLNLPGMDGYAALHLLRQDPHYAALASIPVVAITANAMKRDIERGLAAGFCAYLTKPLALGSFLQLLAEHLPPAQS